MGLMELVDSLSLFGETLIKDDKADLGYLNYRNRRRHKYHGRHAPDHPSPWHHWQVGSALLMASYLLAPLAMAVDMREELDGELTG